MAKDAFNIERKNDESCLRPFIREANHSVVTAGDVFQTVVYQIDTDDRLCLTNDEWDRFALANGAPDETGNQVLGSLIRSRTVRRPKTA